MSNKPAILAIDQGTTSSRAIVFDQHGGVVSVFRQEFDQLYPANGWVEHNPEDIWQTVLVTARQAFQQAEQKGYEVISIGITNQRETTLIWERDTLAAIYPAIVWQDRRTAELCKALKDAGHEEMVTQKTGLLLDPYFSASKIYWILNNVSNARERAANGELAFGTVDSYLIAQLTAGKVHATDATNASRTSLFDISTQTWDDELISLFNVPAELLPEVKDSSSNFGMTEKSIFGRKIPIFGVAGDQQAATVGQACFETGDIKSTYGTGCFAMLNTGKEIVRSSNRLLSTVAYRLSGETTYALEGSIFMAGASVQWLRDEVQLIEHADETEALARSIASTDGVYLVPAFTGLGAPHWDPDGSLNSPSLGLANELGDTLEVAYREIGNITVSAVKTATPAQAISGQPISFTLTACETANTGDATNVIATDTLSAIYGLPSNPGGDVNFTYSSPTLSCDFGTIVGGSCKTCTFDVIAP